MVCICIRKTSTLYHITDSDEYVHGGEQGNSIAADSLNTLFKETQNKQIFCFK
jgi:hypothetical protein